MYGARELAEDDDHQARRHGLLDRPSPDVDQPRYEDDPAANPDEPGEDPPQDSYDGKKDEVQKVHRPILAERRRLGRS